MSLATNLITREKDISNIEQIIESLKKAENGLETSNGATALLVKKLKEKSQNSLEPNSFPALTEVAQFVTAAEELNSLEETAKKTRLVREQTRAIKEEATRLNMQVQSFSKQLNELQGVYENRLLNIEKTKELASKTKKH